MSRTRFDHLHCGIARTLDQVGDWWTLLIVRDAFLGRTRFNEFQESLGIARNILADRLARLVDHGILEKVPLPEPGRRHAYRLTRKGRDLWLVLTAMRLWADRWVFGEGHEPLEVRERGTGRVVAGLVAVDADGRPVDPGTLEWIPGPGASPR